MSKSKSIYSAIFNRTNKLYEARNRKSAAEAKVSAVELIAHVDLSILYRADPH